MQHVAAPAAEEEELVVRMNRVIETIPAKRRAVGGLAVAAALALSACAVSVTTDFLHDDRIDHTARANGPAGIIGDSVGLGLVVYGGLWTRLGQDGWGPVRSFSVLGMHAAPSSPTDSNTVARWVGTFRKEGVSPKVLVVVAGSNDVGYPGGGDAVVDASRIETAMRAIGSTPTVWTTISHPNVTFMNAWNAALKSVATRHANLHVCDWAAQLPSHPSYLEKDKVHMTVGPTGGYVAMQHYVDSCVRLATGKA